MSNNIKNELIKIAYANPELRAELLPLITGLEKAASWQPHNAKDVEKANNWDTALKPYKGYFTGTTMSDMVRSVLAHQQDGQPKKVSLEKKGPLQTDIYFEIKDGEIKIRILKWDHSMKEMPANPVALEATIPVKQWLEDNKAEVKKV